MLPGKVVAMGLSTKRRHDPSLRFWIVVSGLTVVGMVMAVLLVNAFDPPGGDLWIFAPAGFIPAAADVLVARRRGQEQGETR